MYFNDFSNMKLWQHFVQHSGIFCATLIEGIMRNNSVKYFEFGPVLQEKVPLTMFLVWKSGGPFVLQSKTICAILVEGIKRNYFAFWTSGLGDDVY